MKIRRRSAPLSADRTTLVLGAIAGVAVIAVVAGELQRVWRRGSAPLPVQADDIIGAAETAVVETAEVARAGYSLVSTRENALFNLLTSFVTTFLTARAITYQLRTSPRVGPFRNVRAGRWHVHHFVPGIAIAFAAGGGALLTREETLEPWLAIPFGVGVGLTLDESALLLELDDVYWSREGLLSVQITLAVAAMLAALALGLRFLRRGEEIVLEPGPQAGG